MTVFATSWKVSQADLSTFLSTPIYEMIYRVALAGGGFVFIKGGITLLHMNEIVVYFYWLTKVLGYINYQHWYSTGI